MPVYSSPDFNRVTLRFNKKHYLGLVAARGWKTQGEQACGLGLSQATVGKILSGKQKPGPEAIAALLVTFPDQDFFDLFDIVDQRNRIVARAPARCAS